MRDLEYIVIYLGKWVEFFSKKCWGSHMAFLALWWPKWQIKIYDEETPQSQVKKPKKVFSFFTRCWIFFYDTYIFYFLKKYEFYKKIYKRNPLVPGICTKIKYLFIVTYYQLRIFKKWIFFSWPVSYFYYVFPR